MCEYRGLEGECLNELSSSYESGVECEDDPLTCPYYSSDEVD